MLPAISSTDRRAVLVHLMVINQAPSLENTALTSLSVAHSPASATCMPASMSRTYQASFCTSMVSASIAKKRLVRAVALANASICLYSASGRRTLMVLAVMFVILLCRCLATHYLLHMRRVKRGGIIGYGSGLNTRTRCVRLGTASGVRVHADAQGGARDAYGCGSHCR